MIDLVSLHITCKPLLIKTIECFAHGWSNHPLSTEHNETPTRLFQGKLIEFWNAEGDDCDLLRQVSVIVLKKTVQLNMFYIFTLLGRYKDGRGLKSATFLPLR
jgi:hypothetical protein